MLTKLRHFVPIEILIDVFYALIHSYLRYGILVWGNASNSSLEPLKALINKAIRIISFCPVGNINLSQIYKELNLLNFENVLDLEYAKFVFKEKKKAYSLLKLETSSPPQQISVIMLTILESQIPLNLKN